MCGINFIQSSFEVKKINYLKKLDECNFFLKKNKIEKILQIVRLLKRNQIYIELIKKNNLELKRKLLILQKNLEKIKIDSNFDLIEDILWIIKKEIIEDSEILLEKLKTSQIRLNDKSIIFLKYYLNSLESLNYLETRGRDSLGLAINILSKKKINLLNSKKINNNNYNFFQKKISKNKYLLNIVIKYSNIVGYAGENIKKINNLFMKSKILNKIDFDDINSFFIIGHTRWASIGEVNLSNCHPFVNYFNKDNSYFYMNGDIVNHDKITTNKKNKFSISDKNCKNDLRFLPYELFLNGSIKIQKLQGSFVLIYHQSESPYKLSILKKGTQGLYIANNNDENLLFSSDVYGIVNNTNKFQRISDNTKFDINPFKINNFSFKKNKWFETQISTRDLDRRNFPNFFLKEINDTEVFIKRTINNYLDLKKNKIINMNSLFSKKIEKLIIQGKINNIIFTGMGSCYTAAVGISKYLTEKLNKLNIYDIKVQASIASEGSGFYLSKNMSNSIVIVIAQSGTTIDTNVYAKIAKNRGAHTISLVNKRDGDITYIVKNNLYLGSGRDIELSVPSTKTYTCHLYLGFILCDKIIGIFNTKYQSDIFEDAKKIINSNEIQNQISNHTKKINNINFDILKYKKWIVVYDDSTNAHSALEFRIKLSECCYKSIVYMHINHLTNSNFENCLIFYIGEKNITNKKFTKKNFLVSVSSKEIKKKNNVISIVLKNKLNSLFIIESSVVLQLIAYKISSLIDKKHVNVINNLNNKKLINYILDKKDKKIYFKLRKKFKVKFLSDKLKRPIDAIKHQAKTVTVGAIRDNKKIRKFNFNKTKPSVNAKLKIFGNKVLKLKKKMNLISETEYDIAKYFFGNLIEYYNAQYKTDYFYNFIDLKRFKKMDSKFHNIVFGAKNKTNLDNFLFIEKDQINSHELIKSYLINDKKNLENEMSFINAKKRMNKEISKFNINLKKYFRNFNNIKFLGSGINYLVAKKYALKFSKELNLTIGYDVIENHKHIDISSEPLLVIFASNIYRSGFQNDIVSEVEKFIAHNNSVIVFTNRGNDMFDKFLNSKYFEKIIKLPVVNEIYSLSLFDNYFQKIS